MREDIYRLSKERQKHMDKYILQKELFDLPIGTVFVHDMEDRFKGSPAAGCLKLAWTDDGNCQKGVNYCGETFILHADVRKDVEWFIASDENVHWKNEKEYLETQLRNLEGKNRILENEKQKLDKVRGSVIGLWLLKKLRIK
ncbi:MULTISPECIES: hypothetical protein [Bacillus cereus group]|uniref:hypothetical protein n=1 Tax=Bacillus cereus group TaxID=86661 RepID=UPI0009930950|nr:MULTISPECIES: hypothetical protein [Bacillus cereus group]OOR18149.1 hypothetical protein BW891_14400 [Bacillus mycoides]QWG81362.1 hypothetical protein EXW27_28125 [Bacillus mycoides]TXR90715.1 hypothetical protein DN408_01395 [Bacillus sp. AR13-1]